MRISDWSSDVCSSDLGSNFTQALHRKLHQLDAHAGLLHNAFRHPYGEHRISADVEEVVRRLHVHVQQLRPDPDQVGLARSGGLGGLGAGRGVVLHGRSEEHTSELKSLMRISYAVFRLKNNKKTH